jgi:Subtilase family
MSSKWRRCVSFSGGSFTTACCTAVVALLGATEAASQASKQISPSAARQIEKLLDEKATRTPTQRKIGSDLLLNQATPRGGATLKSVPELRSEVAIDEAGRTEVDIKGEVTVQLLQRIEDVGGVIVSSFPQYQAVRARLPLERLEEVAELDEVRSIRRAEQPKLHQINVSEGDVAHRAEEARAAFGVDGTGVQVGVLSDSIEALSDLIASGDLPDVTVLPGQAGPAGISEGTAMLEIVHDLAPGAELLFATAFTGQPQFAQNIRDLRAAGADIIVDDIFYFAEPVFQDGIIAQAVEDVVADGAQYYSSAGNSGNLNDGTSGVWEGDFAEVPAPPVLAGLGAHDFGGGANFNTIIVDSPFSFTLQWSDPFGASANDYDLFLLSPDLTTVVGLSTNIQDGDDDPFEEISSEDADGNNIDDTGNTLVIIRYAGAAARYLHLNANRGRLEFATDGQTSGHSAAVAAFSVAAVDVATAGGGPFVGGAANPVETFSSDGPRQIFFEADGTPITPGDLLDGGGLIRQKPDLAAADGVSTATPDFDPFFGTSAAAPHAAAIGALLLSHLPTLTPDEVRERYAKVALDIEEPGIDRDSGIGVINALPALAGLIEVAVDIRPRQCPSILPTNQRGFLLPVAILGTADFDVRDINQHSIRLAGVRPRGDLSRFDDVATPFEPFLGRVDADDCTNQGADGFEDLVMRFVNRRVVRALRPLSDGQVVAVPLTGELWDGTPIRGEDVVVAVRQRRGS